MHDKYKIVKISGVKLSVHRWTTTCSHTSIVKLLFTHKNVISSLSFVLYGPARIYLLKGKIIPFPRRIQDTLEIMKNCVSCMCFYRAQQPSLFTAGLITRNNIFTEFNPFVKLPYTD